MTASNRLTFKTFLDFRFCAAAGLCGFSFDLFNSF